MRVDEVKRRIAVMEAYLRGETIEFSTRSEGNQEWSIAAKPNFTWGFYDYRVAEKTKEITLTEDEARAVWEVLYRVSGSPTDSPRKYTEQVYHKLCSAFGFSESVHDMQGMLQFKNT